MPGKRSFNLLRMFEIQMKNGFLKEVPWEYEIARKYPPLSADPNDRFESKSLGKVGYLKYYNAALDRNPLMFGEGVHHAYWRQKPLAMILAQKQYELIQQGMEEEAAYQQAIAYVDEFESKAYDNLKNILNSIKFDMHGRDTLISDPETAVAIEECRRKLEKTPYPELSLKDQGDIDFIIQTKILKWLEVERERRMRDPVFYQQFEKLRLSIFPEIKTNISATKLKGEKWQLRNLYFSSVELQANMISTQIPFFYEDYSYYFSKLKSQPNLSRWPDRDRRNISLWIVKVLAYRHMLEKMEKPALQKYIDLLRAQFFPMVQYPARVKSFNLPTVDEFKALLYKNDIGYKPENNKLFVKRFYRVPGLLFPLESIASSVLLNSEFLK